MKWILDKKNRLINTKYLKNIRCCESKFGFYEIWAKCDDSSEIVIYSNESQELRDHKFYDLTKEFL